MTKQSAINWFEIPVQDFARAVGFYQTVLATTLKQELFGDMPMAVFPASDPGVGGALVADPRRRPNDNGTLIYLDATGQLDAALARVIGAGGQVVLPRTHIGEPGFIALVRDPEGNCVGLHAPA